MTRKLHKLHRIIHLLRTMRAVLAKQTTMMMRKTLMIFRLLFRPEKNKKNIIDHFSPPTKYNRIESH